MPSLLDYLSLSSNACPQLFRELFRVEREYTALAGQFLNREDAWQKYASLGVWVVDVLNEVYPPSPDMVLEGIDGPYRGHRYALMGRTVFVIGRREGLAVSLPLDLHLSRTHCLLQFEPPGARLTDLKSRTGTHVNGIPIQTASLVEGDVVRIGSSSFRVSFSDAGTDKTWSRVSMPMAES